MKHRKLLAVCLLICSGLLANQPAAANQPVLQSSKTLWAVKFIRTELYFGTDKPDGSEISAADWDKFLADEVTPRFPEGFTVVEGFGQFRDAAGKIVREKSKVLILLYPKQARKAVNVKIEELRAVYKKQFQQESVLRLDFSKSVEVSF